MVDRWPNNGGSVTVKIMAHCELMCIYVCALQHVFSYAYLFLPGACFLLIVFFHSY